MKLKLTLLVMVLGSLSKTLLAQSLYLPNGSAGVGTSTNTNLGIGIGTPLNKLHILGDFRLDGTAGLPLNSTNNDPNNYGNMYLTKMTSANNALFFSVSNVTNGRAAYIQSGHYLPSYSSYTGILGLNPFGGAVAIGTNTPYQHAQVDIKGVYGTNKYASQLHLHTNNNATGMFLGSYGTKVGIISVGNHYNISSKHLALADKAMGIQMNEGNIRFYTNEGLAVDSIYTPTYRMSITPAGNVGIGITTPAAALHVVGNGIRSERFSVSNIDNLINDSPWYGIGRSDIVDLSGTGAYKAVQVAGYYGLVLRTSAAQIRMHQTGNISVVGKLGIGTSSPDAPLTVKGIIHAEEVKIDLSVPAPDYVFEPSYPLAQLNEVEAYIKENKHLPEVPSAKEMEEKGVMLLEMNMLLLKKVEELTLHLIAQDKINQTQEKTIEVLNQLIKLEIQEKEKMEANLKMVLERISTLENKKGE